MATMVTGILYFSATGNSLYISQRLQRALGGVVRYIPTYTSDGGEFERVVVVTPVYSFGMPTFVYDLIPRLAAAREVVFVQNYGGMLGGADYFLLSYARSCGVNVRAVYVLKMPESFTLTFSTPGFYQRMVLRRADARIDRVAEGIARGERVLPSRKRTREESYYRNKNRWHLIGRDLSVTDACVRCGACVRMCPAGNITLAEDGVRFGDGCVACLACYHRCPQRAIVYKNGTKRDCYVNPNVDERDIGRDWLAQS